MTHNVAVARILDNLNDNNHALIFMTTALRSMFETGHTDEPDLDRGVFLYMSDLTDKYLELEKSVAQFMEEFHPPATSARRAGLTEPNDQEQET